MADPAEMRSAKARELVNELAAKQFAEATGKFDATMKEVLPATQLESVWRGFADSLGKLESVEPSNTERIDEYDIVYVNANFERGKLRVRVVFNTDQQISGLFFRPGSDYQVPGYVDAAKYEQREVTFGRSIWKLPGTLSVPRGEGPWPCIILVHGSGPNDRDETIGPNKPFRDLALGLASRKVAVLQYDKRTKAHSLAMTLLGGSITTKEEAVEDVALAVAFLEQQEGIDPRRIYVLGHSLGGMLLPRIAAATDKAAGYIALAGSTRPLEDVILDQVHYIVGLDGETSEAEQEQLEALQQQVANVKKLNAESKLAASELPLGIPVAYWLDLKDYDPAQQARTIEKPLLILQGDRDYQVTLADYQRWEKSLAGRSNVKLIRYPDLNHLFIAGEGKSTPSEYLQAGNVAPQVIEDIAAWVLGSVGPASAVPAATSD